MFYQSRKKASSTTTAPSATRAEIVQPPSDLKKYPKRTFEPVIKSRRMIVRRASSIEPRDKKSTSVSKDERKASGGETLSWAEIRKRRKVSAPLIKVILKEEPSPEETNGKTEFDSVASPKSFEEAVKLFVDTSASSSSKSSPIREHEEEDRDSSTDVDADDEPEAIPEDKEDADDEAEYADGKDNDEKDEETEDSLSESTSTELCDENSELQSSPSPSHKSRREKFDRSVRIKSPKVSIEQPSVLKEENEMDESEKEEDVFANDKAVAIKVAEKMMIEINEETKVQLRNLLKTAKELVDHVLEESLKCSSFESEEADVVSSPDQDDDDPPAPQVQTQQFELFHQEIETVWEEEEEEEEEDFDEAVFESSLNHGHESSDLISLEQGSLIAVDQEDDGDGDEDVDDLSEKSVSHIVASVKRELSHLSIDECIRRFSEKISTLSESCDWTPESGALIDIVVCCYSIQSNKMETYFLVEVYCYSWRLQIKWWAPDDQQIDSDQFI